MIELLLRLHAYRFLKFKSQAVCCRVRLHVIVFDKITILSSERASNCTNTLCFYEVSKEDIFITAGRDLDTTLSSSF